MWRDGWGGVGGQHERQRAPSCAARLLLRRLLLQPCQAGSFAAPGFQLAECGREGQENDIAAAPQKLFRRRTRRRSASAAGV